MHVMNPIFEVVIAELSLSALDHDLLFLVPLAVDTNDQRLISIELSWIREYAKICVYVRVDNFK